MPPKIAITMGDPAGIGPEVAVHHRSTPGEELLPRVGENSDLRADPRGVPHRDGDLSPHFSPGFVARGWRRAWIQGARREGPGGVVETTLRSPTERNAVDMPVSAAVAEGW